MWLDGRGERSASILLGKGICPPPPRSNRVYFAHEKNIVGRSGHDGLASRQVTGEDKLKGCNYSGTRQGASTQQLHGGKGKARRNWEDNIWWDLMGHGDEQGLGWQGCRKCRSVPCLKRKKKVQGKLLRKPHCVPQSPQGSMMKFSYDGSFKCVFKGKQVLSPGNFHLREPFVL